MNSKSAVLTKLNSPLKFLNLKIPKLKRGQVLVKIYYSGFCSSQYGEITGIKGRDKYLPHCLGHEGCGEILSCGPGVKYKKNDFVVLHWMKGKGIESNNIFYHEKKTNRKINSGKITTFNQYSIISENRLTKVDKKKYNLKYLPLMGCSIPVSFSTLEKILKIKSKKNILILGSGALGLPAIHYCKKNNLNFIDVVDNKMKSLLLAKKFGAKRCFKSIESNEIRDMLNKNSYDYIFDTIGSSKVMNYILKFDINCKIAFLGVPKKNEFLKLNSLKINYGLKLLGSYGGGYMPEKDLKKYLNFLEKTKFNFKNYVSKTYKFSQLNKLINDYKKGKILGKALIQIQ